MSWEKSSQVQRCPNSGSDASGVAGECLLTAGDRAGEDRALEPRVADALPTLWREKLDGAGLLAVRTSGVAADPSPSVPGVVNDSSVVE